MLQSRWWFRYTSTIVRIWYVEWIRELKICHVEFNVNSNTEFCNVWISICVDVNGILLSWISIVTRVNDIVTHFEIKSKWNFSYRLGWKSVNVFEWSQNTLMIHLVFKCTFWSLILYLGRRSPETLIPLTVRNPNCDKVHLENFSDRHLNTHLGVWLGCRCR